MPTEAFVDKVVSDHSTGSPVSILKVSFAAPEAADLELVRTKAQATGQDHG